MQHEKEEKMKQILQHASISKDNKEVVEASDGNHFNKDNVSNISNNNTALKVPEIAMDDNIEPKTTSQSENFDQNEGAY